MKLPLASLCVAAAAAAEVLSLSAPVARAQSGILLKTFDVKAGKLLLDPARPRLYATLPQDNSLAVIDTDTNTVLTQVFIGSNPVDMTISADGTRLYVANQGSTAAGIGVVDLTNLTTLPSLPTPSAPSSLAIGLGNRLYALAGSSSGNGIVQIDASTGALQGSFGGYVYGGYLRLSPDRATLFYGNAGLSPSTLKSFDVSTAMPGAAKVAGSTGSDGEDLVISHNGQFLIYPGGSSQGNYGTYLIPSSLSGILGTFNTGAYPGVDTFSADDTLLYQVQAYGGTNGQNAFKVFSTSTFTQLDRFVDPNPNSTNGRGGDVTDIAVTSPHGYLYVAQMGTTDATFLEAGNLELVSTQPPAFLDGSVALSGGFYYLKFSDGVPFGYYNFNYPPFLYHADLGFEYPYDAADGQGGVYLYDFKSRTFWYTSSSLFPYLYDFTLSAFLYYYPDPHNADRYNTNGVRYFYNFATRKIITK